MQRCIELAEKGNGYVAPNPMVGAVIVHNDTIIGEGFHRLYGQAHAEVNAINEVLTKYENASELLKESTIYVSLEPCSHTGRTPPCANLIIKHGLKKVVVGCKDVFHKVNGSGIALLKANGIEVIESVLEAECKALNKKFFTFHKLQRPYIILKWAQTPNRFISQTGLNNFKISNALSHKIGHKLRAETAAIWVGYHTAMNDNPTLNTRQYPGENPVRVLIDKDLSIPTSHNIYNSEAKTLIFNTIKNEIKDNVHFIKLNEDISAIQHVLYQLYLLDIQSVMIEGGAALLSKLIEENLWDEAHIFTGTTEAKHGLLAPTLPINTLENTKNVGNDILRFYNNK